MTALADAFRTVAPYAERWLAYRRQALRLPGVQAAIWVDGELVLSTAHGHADVEADVVLTPDHLFRIASHSKTFTAAAIGLLVQDGALRLDDRLDAHLPWAGSTGVGDRTLAQLLGHAGGVLRDGRDADHWQLTRPFPDDDGLRALAAASVKSPADERFAYSNVAFGLLGAVVAAASGRSYREFVTERLVRPLGLQDTAPDLVADRLGDYARPYTSLAYAERRRPIELVDTGALDAATGFTSTAADLARWGAALLPGDDGVLDDATLRALRRPGFDVDERNADAGRYGLGLQLREVHGHATYGHGGGYPGHGTRLTILPDDRVTVAVCINAIDGAAEGVADGLVGLATLAAADPDGAPVGPGVDRFTGRYASLWQLVDLVRLGRRLLLLSPGSPDPTAGVVALEPAGDDDTYRVVRTPGFGSPGETLAVTTDASGAVTAVRGPGGVTLWPEERVRAFVAERDEVRLGDLGTLPAGPVPD